MFVPNATTGINSIVRSLVKTFEPGDSILMLDIAYGITSLIVLCSFLLRCYHNFVFCIIIITFGPSQLEVQHYTMCHLLTFSGVMKIDIPERE